MAREKISRAAQLLTMWRVRKKFTQRYCANKFHVDPSHYSKWERGTWKPSLKHAVDIERFTDGVIPCGAWLEKPLHSVVVDPSLNPDATILVDIPDTSTDRFDE